MSQAGGQPGDLASFLALYDDAAPQVYRHLYRLCAGDAALAEDLTQETFVTAVGRFNEGRGADVSTPWLMGVARNKLLEHHRRAGREERRLRLVFVRGEEETSNDDRAPVSRDEAIILLKDLSSDQRTALALRYVEDLAVVDVASTMGRSVRATESLLARARRSLRLRSGAGDHA